MGWANCGTDSKGRPIGYAHAGTCDDPGCDEKIDRGLSYACGGMHGEDEHSCEGYFCHEHLHVLPYKLLDGFGGSVCSRCELTLNGIRLEDAYEIERERDRLREIVTGLLAYDGSSGCWDAIRYTELRAEALNALGNVDFDAVRDEQESRRAKHD